MTDLTLAKVEQAAVDLFKISDSDLIGRSRAWPLHQQRTATILVMRDLTGASWTQIGDWFGRDHSTVMSCARSASPIVRRFAERLTLALSGAVGEECRVCGGPMVEADPVFEVSVGYVYRQDAGRCERCGMTFLLRRQRQFHAHLSDLQMAAGRATA